MVLALFNAHFTLGQDIGKKAKLEEIALSVGMKDSDIQYAYEENARTIVDKKIARLKQLEINSAPTYVINDKYMIHGAHSPEDFFKTLNDIAEKSQSA